MIGAKSGRLLVVDDMPTMRKTLRHSLERLGYQTAGEAADGKEAMNILLHGGVDVVLSDWSMPRMDGLALLREMRAHPETAQIPLILVTGELERSRVTEAIRAGVTDFIAKPFTAETLSQRVENALQSGVSAHTGAKAGIAKPPAPRQKDPEKSRSRQQIILTVDDERDNIEIVTQALKPKYAVKAAINGRVALKAARGNPPPDLILLDIMMPEMDGMAVLKALKEDPKTADIPVIFVTAKGTGYDIAAGLAAGAEDYVVKPIHPLVLLARIATQLRLKKANDNLREQLDLMVEHVRLQEDVDRMVRHDIRNPLSAIIGYAEELGDLAYLSNPQRDVVEKIEQAAFTVSEIVNFSIELMRIERGDYQPKPTEIDLTDLARRVIRDLRPLARTHQAEVELQDQNTKVTAYGERLLVYTIIANLIRNAIEASKARESVLIRFEADGHQMAKVHVLNKAVVPPQIRGRLFEKGATFGKEEGSGLGAYSAKLMARTLGGSLTFTTSEADGTCFTLALPVHKSK